MSKTEDNLRAAFAGESQANRKYLAYAQKAEDENKPEIAKIFRVAAEAETIHAHNHFRVLGGVKTTEENLADAIAGETYEAEEMYPEFLAEAESQNDQAAQTTFRNAKHVEAIHERMFKEALEKNASGEKLEDVEYHICPVCGFPAGNQAPERCPVCGAPGERFYKL
ncbi:MAG: rubrerythrin family protein [Candidatus Moranbacteria bacterium]|nr:rubrerythrin family protein [Candidatus Moranbacteria bacterium]